MIALAESKTPKISIGMPVFNGGLFIEAALASLLNQSYKNFELIISDNASSDSTETICKKYLRLDSRITYIKQTTNKGGLENFYTVLSHATGEYFMWAAADDVWDLNWIETLLEISIANNCIAFGRVRQIDLNGDVLPYLSNNIKLSFGGLRHKRRAKFFFTPGSMGKANLIYAIFPKAILTPKVLGVLGLNFIHVDMLFVYNLLNKIEIKGGAKTFLNKRIVNPVHLNNHDNCVKKYSPYKFFQYYCGYYSLSSRFEKALLIAIFIPSVTYDILARTYSKIFLLVRNNLH